MLCGPPLEPGADEARRLLEVELSRPEYQEQISLLDRVLRWLVARLPDPTAGGSPVPLGILLLVCLALAVLGILAWRMRDVREVAAERRRRVAGLTDPRMSAADYRAAAEGHLAEGAADRAVVAAFRALVVELDERDIVHDAPGRTAHEVAAGAAQQLPARGDEMRWAADCFDAACYGHPDGPLPGPGEPQRTCPDDVRRLLALSRVQAVAR